MRRTKLFCVVVILVCALGALLASTAFALEFELGQWLANGAFLLSAFGSETNEEVAFENTEAKVGILCSTLLDGTLGPESSDEVTKMLNLSAVEIPELDEAGATGGLDCVSTGNVCENGSELWPVNLPWRTELVLDKQTGEFYDLYILNAASLRPAYFILCLELGVSMNELCEMGESTGTLIGNIVGGVELKGLAEPLGTCRGKSGVGDMTAGFGSTITFNDDDTVSVSE